MNADALGVAIKPIDLLLLGVIGWMAWKGYKRGLLIELINTAGLVVAIIVAFMFADLTSGLIKKYLYAPPLVATLLGIVGSVVGLVFIIKQLGNYSRSVLHQTLFGSLDKVAGGMLAIVKITFAISSMLWALKWLGVKFPAQVTSGTFVFPVVQAMGPKFFSILALALPYLKKMYQQIEPLAGFKPGSK